MGTTTASCAELDTLHIDDCVFDLLQSAQDDGLIGPNEDLDPVSEPGVLRDLLSVR